MFPRDTFRTDFTCGKSGANDQMFKAKDYRPLMVAYNKGAPVRLSDVADVIDSVEDVRNMGMANGQPSVNVAINRQPGANIIETVDRIRAALPQLKAAIPHSINLNVTQDQTVTIRASVRDIERTMIISVLLVVLVVFVFLRSPRTTMIPERGRPGFADRDVRRDVSVRLQPGQSLADGSDHFHRLRGGRRHRGDRKYHALPGAGHEALRRRAARRARDRFDSAHHERFADSRLHSAADDGRHRRPPVSRIRGDHVGGHCDFDGGLAHHHAHDVRASAQGARHARLAVPDQRARIQLDRRAVREHARPRAAASRHYPGRARGHHRPQRVPLHSRAQGIFPAAGQWPVERDHHRRSGHLVPSHGKEPSADGEDRPGRIRRWTR